jgi:hypothetical protein
VTEEVTKLRSMQIDELWKLFEATAAELSRKDSGRKGQA